MKGNICWGMLVLPDKWYWKSKQAVEMKWFTRKGRKAESTNKFLLPHNMPRKTFTTTQNLANVPLTTTATMSPPAACTVTTVQTMVEYPPSIPCSDIAAESFTNIVIKAMTMDGNPICTFRNHNEVVDPFKIFSK